MESSCKLIVHSFHIQNQYSSSSSHLLFVSHHFFSSPITPLRLPSLLFTSHHSLIVSHHSSSSPITSFRLPSLLFVSHHFFLFPITTFHLSSCPISPFCFLSLLITLFFSFVFYYFPLLHCYFIFLLESFSLVIIIYLSFYLLLLFKYGDFVL
ncbi:hypothetical protein RhiirC2_57845 [Rhizophagus irregularis]|uniref:Uncharacterized protein n=1 Tax=Rhizophagus irregularis TaxID=588596 RepID=A0A2N1MVM1_9GLOM|nr:hypothetical protein RhiirC2_57845 [Rhizophagus irregularis]